MAKKESIAVWVYQCGLTHDKKPQLLATDSDLATPPEGWALVAGPLTLEFEWPESYDPIKVTIDGLNQQLVKARNDFAELARRINDQIQSLLAIEHQPAKGYVGEHDDFPF